MARKTASYSVRLSIAAAHGPPQRSECPLATTAQRPSLCTMDRLPDFASDARANAAALRSCVAHSAIAAASKLKHRPATPREHAFLSTKPPLGAWYPGSQNTPVGCPGGKWPRHTRKGRLRVLLSFAKVAMTTGEVRSTLHGCSFEQSVPRVCRSLSRRSKPSSKERGGGPVRRAFERAAAAPGEPDVPSLAASQLRHRLARVRSRSHTAAHRSSAAEAAPLLFKGSCCRGPFVLAELKLPRPINFPLAARGSGASCDCDSERCASFASEAPSCGRPPRRLTKLEHAAHVPPRRL